MCNEEAAPGPVHSKETSSSNTPSFCICTFCHRATTYLDKRCVILEMLSYTPIRGLTGAVGWGPVGSGHTRQTERPGECLGGFRVLPEPVPGAPRSQMALPGSRHSTCLSSWEEVAGLALGTGCEATAACTSCAAQARVQVRFRSRWRAVRSRVAPSATSLNPGLPVRSCLPAPPIPPCGSAGTSSCFSFCLPAWGK